MQIALVPHNLAPVGVPSDIVSPSRLFEYAGERFHESLDALRTPSPDYVADSPSADDAVQSALAGIRTLEAVLVPGTPFSQRQRAETAIGLAREGVLALEHYRDAVISRGAGGIQRSTLGTAELRDLVLGQTNILSALGHVSPEA